MNNQKAKQNDFERIFSRVGSLRKFSNCDGPENMTFLSKVRVIVFRFNRIFILDRMPGQPFDWQTFVVVICSSSPSSS